MKEKLTLEIEEREFRLEKIFRVQPKSSSGSRLKGSEKICRYIEYLGESQGILERD